MMRFLVSLCILLVFHSQSLAEDKGIAVQAEPGVWMFFNTSSIEPYKGNHVRYWVRKNYTTMQHSYGVAFNELVLLNEFDCLEKRDNILQLIAKNKGKEVFSGSYPEWEYPERGSWMYAFGVKACSIAFPGRFKN